MISQAVVPAPMSDSVSFHPCRLPDIVGLLVILACPLKLSEPIPDSRVNTFSLDLAG